MNAATAVLTVFNYVCFGTTVHGRKYLKAVENTGAVTVCNHIHPMDCTMVNTALWGRRRYFVPLKIEFSYSCGGTSFKGTRCGADVIEDNACDRYFCGDGGSAKVRGTCAHIS